MIDCPRCGRPGAGPRFCEECREEDRKHDARRRCAEPIHFPIDHAGGLLGWRTLRAPADQEEQA